MGRVTFGRERCTIGSTISTDEFRKMIELTDKPIDLQQLVLGNGNEECGAQVFFVGTTRRWTKRDMAEPLETDHLLYEAYEEMALSKLEELEREAFQRWPVKSVKLIHRLGRVDPEEPSVAVAVSCPHRAEAFEAARWLIDTLKHEVPIWKQEHYVQNGQEWIHPTAGNCNCESAAGPEVTRAEANRDSSSVQ